MTSGSSNSSGDSEVESASSVVFRGTKLLCNEYSLVLEAQKIDYEVRQSGEVWLLCVAPSVLQRSYEEIDRYSIERSTPRRVPQPAIEPHPGAAIGIVFYILILLLVAYCAGNGMLGLSWLDIGSLDGHARGEWWRAFTALTLHVDQEHLLGNVLFGVVAGLAASRLLGPGIAWASIVAAAALANYAEMLVTPITHRAVGASTAVFAALGLLSGMAWRQRLTLRERIWYRWSPLIAGVCLLTLLGAGTAHVDVLGHALGFIFGLGTGWLYARAGMQNYRGRRGQLLAAIGVILALCVAWFAALRHNG